MNSTRNGPHTTAGTPVQRPHLSEIAVAAGAAPGRVKPTGVPDVPPELAEVRLIDGKAAALAGGMSLSWWYEAVAKGIAPQPLFRAPRCTRWRAVDVAAFWRDWRPADAAVSVVDVAKQASAKASERRRAAAAGCGTGSG